MARAQSRRRKFMAEMKARGDLRGLPSTSALSDLLYDELTDLPTVPLLLGRIRRMLGESTQLGLLSISVLLNERAQQTLGWQGYEALVRDVATFLLEVKKVALRRDDYLSEVMISGNAFVILLSPPRGEQRIAYPDIDKVRRRIAVRLNRFVRDRLPQDVIERFGFYIGCAVLAQDPAVRFERLVYSALEEAFTDSLQQRKRQQRRESLRLKEVLRARAVVPVYQPVVDLADRRVLGYEALTRVADDAFDGPDHLFKVAHANDSVWKLERLCRETQLRGARGLAAGQLLFLNVEPDSIHDPALRSESTFQVLREAGLKPSQIVLEMTEHSAVADPGTFRQLLNHLQFQGFRLAVDDVGSGYSGLKSIAELKPDFIKIDMALIRDIHQDAIKQDLTATIARFSVSSGITLIAEGVETVEELACLRAIGVRYAQGYLFARPGPAFPAPDLGLLD
jgi:EAL domain-containing protein (putative c-di-GMP-specific phosphodiesterase class I)